MKYEFLKNEDNGLSVYLPYKNLFDEVYNPEGYEEFPEIEIVINDTEDKEEPSNEQINALEYFLKHSFEICNLISEFIFNEREVLLEKGYQIEDFIELKKKYRFSTIYIDDEYKKEFSFIGLTGICSWDEEHGFGIVMLKNEIIDFGDWNCGYSMYHKFSSDDINSFGTATEHRKKIKELSKEIYNVDNIDDYFSLFHWLINLKAIYGYRDTKLDLTDKEIVALIKNIDKLDLSNKNIDSLCKNFNLLINLKELNLSYNKLIELPDEICEIELEEINLSGNKLKELPNSFGNIKALKGLFLSNNQFYRAPDCIGNLTNLRALHLAGNHISELPKSYENLSCVEILYISNNKFFELPEVIQKWEKINFLHVENNQIKILPSWIGKLKLLRNVNLSNNELVEIPSSISHITELNHLYINNNKLQMLPNEIGKVQSIELQNNFLTSLPEKVKDIQIIKIKNNNISQEKLIEYKNSREGRPPYFNDDFNDELRRLEQLGVKNIFNQNINDNKSNITPHQPKRQNKSGCLGALIILLMLFIYLL